MGSDQNPHPGDIHHSQIPVGCATLPSPPHPSPGLPLIGAKRGTPKTQTMQIYMCELYVNVTSSTGALRTMQDKPESRYELRESSWTDSDLMHTIAKSLRCYSTVDSKRRSLKGDVQLSELLSKVIRILHVLRLSMRR